MRGDIQISRMPSLKTKHNTKVFIKRLQEICKENKFEIRHTIIELHFLIYFITLMTQGVIGLCALFVIYTAQKMKFSIKYFFSKCDQIRSYLRIWSNILKKSLMENLIFYAMIGIASSNSVLLVDTFVI